MENLSQKITQELKVKVIEKLKDQIEVRDAGETKVERLEKALVGYEKKASDLREKIRVFNKKITENLGEGKSVSKIQVEVRGLREQMSEAEDLAKEIKDTAFPDARGALKIAQDDLKIAVQASVAEARGKYEKQMTQMLFDFMNLYDSWISATRNLYDEVKPGLLPGTIHEIPRIICEPFKRYVNQVGLGIYEETIKRDQEEPGPMVEAKPTEEEGQEAGEQQI